MLVSDIASALSEVAVSTTSNGGLQRINCDTLKKIIPPQYSFNITAPNEALIGGKYQEGVSSCYRGNTNKALVARASTSTIVFVYNKDSLHIPDLPICVLQNTTNGAGNLKIKSIHIEVGI